MSWDDNHIMLSTKKKCKIITINIHNKKIIIECLQVGNFFLIGVRCDVNN